MTTQPPKVFISYSHKSPEHDKWVLDLATELRESGVDAMLDIWDKPLGASYKAFTRGIIENPNIQKFLIISDRLYKFQTDIAVITEEESNESTSIPAIDYHLRNPEEFLAVVTNTNKQNEPYFPTYYKSNLYIDLTIPEHHSENFERLLRWIFDKPLLAKPPLGTLPDFTTPKQGPSINTTPINQDYSVRLKHLNVINFRRFTEFDLSFEPQLTVLVARNGAGKSSILDAVATALGPFLTRLPKVSGINTKETDFRVFADGRKPAYMRISATNEDGISWDRTDKRDQSKPTQAEIPQGLGIKALNDYADRFVDAFNRDIPFELPVFIYYGTGRGVFDIPQRKKGFGSEFSRFEALSGALESRNNFKRFVEYFYYLEERESKLQKEQGSFEVALPELIAIRAVLARLLPEFSNPRGAYPAGILVDWESDGKTKQLRIEQLSDGYRTTLAMVMDIASRMAEANPDMKDALATRGIVLIDEVDLHLHPGWQQHILTDLMRTFPNIQFIVSTHSAPVVTSVKPECLRVIDWQDEQPKLIPVLFSEGAEAQQVLLDVLGVDELRPPQLAIVATLKKYQQMVESDQWDTAEAKVLRRQLDKWGAEHEPELARLDIDIRLKALDL